MNFVQPVTVCCDSKINFHENKRQISPLNVPHLFCLYIPKSLKFLPCRTLKWYFTTGVIFVKCKLVQQNNFQV